MKEIKITYSKDILPFVMKTHNGLMLNMAYAPNITHDFLNVLLKEVGFENVPDMILTDIATYPRFLQNNEKDVTVVFSYTSY